MLAAGYVGVVFRSKWCTPLSGSASVDFSAFTVHPRALLVVYLVRYVKLSCAVAAKAGTVIGIEG